MNLGSYDFGESDVIHSGGHLRLGILKISNIAWDLTSTDVQEALGVDHNCIGDSKVGYSYDFFESNSMPLIKKDYIHIPIDRSTGKTKADMFVEFSSILDAIRSISLFNKSILKGRAMLMSISSMEELYQAHFSTQKEHRLPLNPFMEASKVFNICELNQFIDPVDSDFLKTEEEERYKIMKSLDGKYQKHNDERILILDEVNSLIEICHNYKAHFSRKCAERPFEHVISLLRLAPWERMLEEDVKLFYSLSTGAIDALLNHLQAIAIQSSSARLDSGAYLSNTLCSAIPYSIKSSTLKIFDQKSSNQMCRSSESDILLNSIDLSARSIDKHPKTISPIQEEKNTLGKHLHHETSVFHLNNNSKQGITKCNINNPTQQLTTDLLLRLYNAVQSFYPFSKDQKALVKVNIELRMGSISGLKKKSGLTNPFSV